MNQQPIGLEQQPPAPPERNGQDAYTYGTQLVIYLIAYECTALLSIEDLEAAHYAGNYALYGKFANSPDPARIVDRIHRTQQMITATLLARRNELAQLAQLAQLELEADRSQAPASPGLDGGSKVPVHPVPPTMPPAPEYALAQKGKDFAF